MADETTVTRGNVGSGIVLALLNAVVSTIAFLVIGRLLSFFWASAHHGDSADAGGPVILLVFGVFQVGVTQIPGVIFLCLRNSSKPALVQGLIIASSILFLLNAGCWGLVLGPKFLR